jgi:pyridoxamine 5'-phosphate oxidase family protein
VTLGADQIGYLTQQRLGRLATVHPNGQPQANPVSCYYNPTTGTVDIGGHNMAASRKYRNVAASGRAAVVIDDTQGPRGIRCLEIRGRAAAIDNPHDSAACNTGPIIRIWPDRVISWGLSP